MLLIDKVMEFDNYKRDAGLKNNTSMTPPRLLALMCIICLLHRRMCVTHGHFHYCEIKSLAGKPYKSCLEARHTELRVGNHLRVKKQTAKLRKHRRHLTRFINGVSRAC